MAIGTTRILLLLILVLLPGAARADFQGLLLLGDLRQALVLDTLYSGQTSSPKGGSSTSSSQYRFNETYTAGIEYSILHPYVMTGHVKGSFGLDQEKFSGSINSGSSAGSQYFYDVDGLFLKRTPTPLDFTARSETRHIQRPFTQGYDVTSDSYSLGASFKHRFLGLRADYQQTNSETKGTTSDARTTNNLFTLKAENLYKNSTTEMILNRVSSGLDPLSANATAVPDDVSYTVSAKNLLVSNNNDKALSSNVIYREEKQSSIIKTFSLGESFSWQLGKALALGTNYETSSIATQALGGGPISETTQQTASVSLTHNLYKSLSTRLKVQGRLTDRPTGKETEYSGNANFYYTKKLSGADMLTLNYAQEYSVVDRKLSSGILTSENELMTSLSAGPNLLQQPNVISASIVVRDQANPLIVYVLDTDYRITHNGAFTGLDTFGSPRIIDGQRLLITYQYQVDENVSYRRSSVGGGGAMTFQNGVYQVYANVSQSTQETTGGQGVLRPNSSLDFSVGASRDKNGKYANIVYVNSNSEQIKNQYVEGTFRITRNFEDSSINAQARDRETWNGATTFNTTSYSENQLSLSADYAKNVFENGVMSVKAFYFRASSEARNRNDAGVELGYRWGLGKLVLETSARLQYRDSNGDTALDDLVSVRVTRTF
jgi:hypothetical protein